MLTGPPTMTFWHSSGFIEGVDGQWTKVATSSCLRGGGAVAYGRQPLHKPAQILNNYLCRELNSLSKICGCGSHVM